MLLAQVLDEPACAMHGAFLEVTPLPLFVQAMLFTKVEPTESSAEISARHVPGLQVSQLLLQTVLFATVTWPLLKT